MLPDNVVAAFEHIESEIAAATTKVKTNLVRDEVDILCKHSGKSGLSSNDLDRAIAIIANPTGVEQSVQTSILNHLFPHEHVSNTTVTRVIAAIGLGQKKASSTTQQALLKWLLLVYEVLEDRTFLTRYYSVLFNLLDVLYLRAPLVRLLVILTRKKHVQPFRIEVLEGLAQGYTSDVDIARLVRCFESFAPSHFDRSGIKSTSASSFSALDPDWSDRLSKIRSRYGRMSLACGLKGIVLDEPRSGTAADSLISKALPERIDLDSKSDLLWAIESRVPAALSWPDLTNGLVCDYLCLMPRETTDDQLATCLAPISDQTENLDLDNRIFEAFLRFTRSSKIMPQVMLDFLAAYLPRWRPVLNFEYGKIIVEVVSHVPIIDWQELYRIILAPLEAALLSVPDSHRQSLTEILEFYTLLLRNWAITLLAATDGPVNGDHLQTIISCVSHTSVLALTLLNLDNNPSPTTVNVILAHLEAQVTFVQAPLALHFSPPPPSLVYLMMHACPALSILSRISALLASFKQAFEQKARTFDTPRSPPATRNNSSSLSLSGRPSIDTHALNSELIDTCNLLLRSRAFETGDVHSRGCMLPRSIATSLKQYSAPFRPQVDFSHLFSLSCHSSIAGLASLAFQDLEADTSIKHSGPVSQRSLSALGKQGGVKIGWREYRVHVLRWLDEMGVKGFGELGRATMKGLMAPDGKVGKENDVAKIR